MAKKNNAPAAPSESQPKVSRTKLTEFLADPNNVRVHPERAKEVLKGSIDRFGAARSIVVDKDGIVRAGNGAIEAAIQAGLTEALVIETDGTQLVVVKRGDWSDAEATAYAIVDNKANQLSEWNFQGLAAQFATLRDAGGDELLAATGFAPYELEPLMQAEWTPGPVADLPTGADTSSDPKLGKPIVVTKEQREVIDRAISLLRTDVGDPELKEGRAIELICADFIAGQPKEDVPESDVGHAEEHEPESFVAAE